MTESDSNTEFFPGGSLDLSTFTRAFEATVTEDDGFGRISVATSAVTHTSSFVFDDAQRIIGWNFSGTTTGATGYGQSQVDGPPYIRSLVNAQATQGFRFRATEPGTILVATGEHVVAGELSCVEVRVQGGGTVWGIENCSDVVGTFPAPSDTLELEVGAEYYFFAMVRTAGGVDSNGDPASAQADGATSADFEFRILRRPDTQ